MFLGRTLSRLCNYRGLKIDYRGLQLRLNEKTF